MKKKSKFEPGIFNYCDRWCEKCNKTDRCRLFYMEEKNKKRVKKMGIDPDSAEGELARIKISLSDASKKIKRLAEERGVNLSVVAAEKETIQKNRDKTDPSNLKPYKEAFALSEKIHKNAREFVVPNESEYLEATDSLAWHQNLIFVKVARALRSKLESEQKTDMIEIDLDDSRKSAWVACRSAKICINSLETLKDYQDEQQDIVDELISDCEKLIICIEDELLN